LFKRGIAKYYMFTVALKGIKLPDGKDIKIPALKDIANRQLKNISDEDNEIEKIQFTGFIY